MKLKHRNATHKSAPGSNSLEPAHVASQLVGEGDRYLRSGHLIEASASYRKAIAVKPDLPQAYHNLAIAMRRLGKLDEAVAFYRNALALKPFSPETLNNLANALRELGRLDEAAAAYQQALILRPADTEILNNLGAVLQVQGKLFEAISAFRRVIALKPGASETLSNLIYTTKMACDWREIDNDEDKCRAMVRSGAKQIAPFHFMSIASSAAEQLQCARQWARARTEGAGRLPALVPRERERIRLAYLSADFRQHAMAVLAVELFERHDRDRFEVSAYSFGPDDGSAMRQRLHRAFDRFIDIHPLSHADAAKRIRGDGIDILVDLMGYTEGARTPILASRPAPIQVNFLSYPGGMGANYIDYFIADPTTAPMSDQRFYDARIVHLPDCYMPNSPREIADRTPSRTECGLPESGFVFCCFNNSYKLTPVFFDIWMKLLQAVPDSVLWLLDSNPAVSANLGREVASRGVAPDRVVFAPRLPLREHLARHRLADLFLDTLPVNACTTTGDALWAGLPVLTCTGDTFVGRVSASLLHAVGLPEMVVQSPDEYEALAFRLATDPALIEGLRRRLETNRVTAPLFDIKRYTRHLEEAYSRMWRICTAGRSPEALGLNP